MPRKYLAFDIEIANGFPDGEDWRQYRPLGISCAATLADDAEQAKLWCGGDDDGQPADRMSREETAALVDYLVEAAGQGYTILTWNGLAFDFEVLAEESGMAEPCKTLAREHVDMMFHVFCQLGYPVGLDAVAKGMDLPGKPEGMSGLLAPQMWADGKRQEVLDYVAQDVRTTLDVATACRRDHRLCWITRRGKRSRMPLPGDWLTVTEAMKLPQADTSWMDNPIPRRKFTAWLRQ